MFGLIINEEKKLYNSIKEASADTNLSVQNLSSWSNGRSKGYLKHNISKFFIGGDPAIETNWYTPTPITQFATPMSPKQREDRTVLAVFEALRNAYVSTGNDQYSDIIDTLNVEIKERTV